MEKKEVWVYLITIISFIAFVYIVFGAISKTPGISDKKFTSLSGNVVLDLNDNFEIGDNLTGYLILNLEELDAYGSVLLTKDNQLLITRTFNLNEIPKTKSNLGYSIKIVNLIDYEFNQTGNYELFLFVLDLDINIKKKFVVK
jgi:hypothetical protein